MRSCSAAQPSLGGRNRRDLVDGGGPAAPQSSSPAPAPAARRSRQPAQSALAVGFPVPVGRQLGQRLPAAFGLARAPSPRRWPARRRPRARPAGPRAAGARRRASARCPGRRKSGAACCARVRRWRHSVCIGSSGANASAASRPFNASSSSARRWSSCRRTAGKSAAACRACACAACSAPSSSDGSRSCVRSVTQAPAKSASSCASIASCRSCDAARQLGVQFVERRAQARPGLGLAALQSARSARRAAPRPPARQRFRSPGYRECGTAAGRPGPRPAAGTQRQQPAQRRRLAAGRGLAQGSTLPWPGRRCAGVCSFPTTVLLVPTCRVQAWCSPATAAAGRHLGRAQYRRFRASQIGATRCVACTRRLACDAACCEACPDQACSRATACRRSPLAGIRPRAGAVAVRLRPAACRCGAGVRTGRRPSRPTRGVGAGQQHVDGAVERGAGAGQRFALRGHVAAGQRQALAQRRRQLAGARAASQLVHRRGQRALQFGGFGLDGLGVVHAQGLAQCAQARFDLRRLESCSRIRCRWRHGRWRRGGSVRGLGQQVLRVGDQLVGNGFGIDLELAVADGLGDALDLLAVEVGAAGLVVAQCGLARQLAPARWARRPAPARTRPCAPWPPGWLRDGCRRDRSSWRTPCVPPGRQRRRPGDAAGGPEGPGSAGHARDIGRFARQLERWHAAIFASPP